MDLVNSWMLTAVSLVISLSLLLKFFSPKQLSNEPPRAPSTISVIDHLIGFIRYSTTYYEILGEKVPQSIFTLRMPGTKLYIVTEPDLMSKVDKKSNTLSFFPVVKNFSYSALGVGEKTNQIMSDSLLYGHGLLQDTVEGMGQALKPGKQMDEMNMVMLKEVIQLLNALEPENGQTNQSIRLFAFVRETVTMASTNSVYGPYNPYKDSAIRDAFFEFERGIMRLLVSPLPQYTARRYIAAREKVATALASYFAQGRHEHGSALAKARWDYCTRNNVCVEDIGHFEIGGTLAILLNTIPSVYWLLFHLYTYPGLLNDIQKELEAAVRIDSQAKRATLDLSVIKVQCPLLLSAMKESFRCHAIGVGVREVAEDTDFEGFVLKKGGMVHMPVRVAHRNCEHYGSNYASFDPRRFLNDAANKKTPRDSAFRSFGGGKHLCPGRFFAMNEVLTIVTLFVCRFDMRPSDGGEWVLPTTKNSNTVAQVESPDFDIPVDVSDRKEYAGYSWDVLLSAQGQLDGLVANEL